jgi:superfamily II DNA or RNA helicase
VTQLTLRAWQSQFVRKLETHRARDFLLVACPAAGKTLGAAAGAASVMAKRKCDQLVVVCPTVVVRDQWVRDLHGLGYRMQTHVQPGGWEPYVHGVCVTYHQVANRPDQFAAACAQRRTLVILDEIHHAGQQLAWGRALEEAFASAIVRLLLSGTPFRSDKDRIPYVSYDEDGVCAPHFTYDYGQAVRDGVCRPIQFRPHDGLITWREGEGERTARFQEQIPSAAKAKRLRASLDPRHPYLRALLHAADTELQSLRREVEDAAGLVVCDSQEHALSVDRILSQITGSLPVLAISDIPRAHQAIVAFAEEPHEQWLVSVKMVSEGVDIPRLGVIAWATATTTEMMVRQVAGRALRGRERYAGLPAIVHMPADPDLIRFAQRLEILAGALPSRSGNSRPIARANPEAPLREVDPAPFLAWFDQQAAERGISAVLDSCGWGYEAGRKRISRWREPDAKAVLLTLLDACHMADLDFDTLYAAKQYAAARQWVRDPAGGSERADYGAIAAKPLSNAKPPVLAPTLPQRRLQVAGETVALSAPELPRSPQELQAEQEQREARRGELFRLLSVYHQLRRSVDPAYQLASAHRDLAGAVGAVDASSTDEQVAAAHAWLNAAVAQFARTHPEQVKDLARERRRIAIAR